MTSASGELNWGSGCRQIQVIVMGDMAIRYGHSIDPSTNSGIIALILGNVQVMEELL